MADHSKPLTTSTYANFVTELDARFDDLAVGIDPAVTTATNVPTNAIRWTSAANKWQKWNGTAWGDLSSSYAINVSGSAASLSATLVATTGGTGQSVYAVGDLLYASTTTALSKLADVATGNALISGGVGVAPSWGKIALTTHISGILPTANGGTNLSAFTLNGALYASSTSVLTTGTLPIASGGTNSTATPTNGGVVYGTGTALAYSAAGTTGQALLANGGASPVWTTLTLENIPDAWVKRSCLAATTADLAAASATTNTITGTLVVFPAQDGVTFVVGNRLLVKNQTTTSQNGIYTLTTLGVAGVTAWVLTRATDSDTASEIAGSHVNVDAGTVNGGLVFDNDFKSTDTLGTTAMPWYRVLDTGYTIPATQGGTGQTSYAVGDLIYASTTTALSKLADVATGNSLISGGVGVAPSWGKIGLTTHISGTLAVGNGGTGITTYAIGDIVYASTTTTLASLADVATGNSLISGGVGVAPSWGKIGLTTHITGTLATSNGGTGSTATAYCALGTNTSGTLPANQGGTGQSVYAVGDLIYASTTTALSRLADVATGNVLLSGGVGVAPAWGQVGLTTHVTGTLPIGNGGTGSTTADAARIALNVISSVTGSQKTPTGTTAQRDGTPAAGWFRFNTTLSKFEGYNGTAWGAVGGGATGGGSDEVFVLNSQTVTTNYTIPTGYNSMSAGAISINTGVTVTVSTGSNWVIV